MGYLADKSREEDAEREWRDFLNAQSPGRRLYIRLATTVGFLIVAALIAGPFLAVFFLF